MDKKYQKRIAWACSFLAVLLIFVALPFFTYAQNIQNPTIGKFNTSSWYNVLFQWIIGGFGTLVALIGSALDYSIQNFILGFGSKYKTSNLGFTIDALWGTVRDIFNLTFIFGLIFIGFKMILDAGDSHARKTLVSLIGAALLVNFSLFITKFIVDFSNIAAYKVYEAFQNGSGAPLSISVAFANLLGMPSIFNNAGLSSAPPTASILYLIGTLLILLVLAYVYLAGAILIAIRFVVLIIYLVFSPVMFLGWVFPSMHGHSDKYWKGFLSQAFFAPAFLFMLYLSYRVVYNYNDDINKSFNNGGYFNQASFASADSLIPFFIMTMVFLLASMVVAKNMGAVGATSVIKVGHDLRRRGQAAMGGATFGMAARAGRSTIGAGAKYTTDSEAVKKLAARTGFIGKKIYMGTAKVADSSFDARQVGGFGKAAGIGEGKKGGFTTRLKENEKSEKAYLDALGKVGKAKVDTNPAVINAKAAEKAAQEAVNAKKAEISAATAGEKTQINDLSTEFKTATEARKIEIASQMNALKAKIDIKQQEIETYDANLKIATASLKTITAKAEYANQLIYNENLEAARKWEKKLTIAAASIGAGILTGGAGFGILAMGAAAAAGAGAGAAIGGGNSYSNYKTAQALKKEYGSDGTAKQEAEHKKHNLKILAEEMEHVNGHSPAPAAGGGGGGGGHAAPPAPAASPASGGGGGHH